MFNGIQDVGEDRPPLQYYGLGDLGCCGCQEGGGGQASGGGMDFSTVPLWVWIGLAAFGAAMVLKKK